MGVINSIFLRLDTGKELQDSFRWYFFPICFFIYLPLVMIRKIETFAKFHVFGDVMIWVTLIAVMIFAGIKDANEGWGTSKDNIAFNSKLWPNTIGFAVYSFEGVGVIIPVYEITTEKKNFFPIVCYVTFGILFMDIVFSEYMLFSYYD
jgi:proton-coupled amino acid transporter